MVGYLHVNKRPGRRTKLELVDVGGRLGVKKTFKPGCERFLERERLAAEQFASRDPHFLPLLAAGENYLVWPYVENTLHSIRHRGRYGPLLPLRVAREAINALHFVWEQGYAVLDARLGNLLVDRDGQVYLIDFEFLHRYETRPARFEESYDIAGVPADVVADAPKARKTYDHDWAPRIGLSLDELLRKRRWQQALLRCRYRIVVGVPRRLWHNARSRASAAREGPAARVAKNSLRRYRRRYR